MRKLVVSDSARYSDIKPKNIGGNQFAHHLKSVIDEGLVQKTGDEYVLTTEGKKLSDRLSLNTFTKRVQPKIATVIIYKRIGKNGKSEMLFCRKEKQPFLGYETLPTGKIHLGEKIFDAARRELFEKTELPADNIYFIGDIYVMTYKNGELFSHILYHIFDGDIESEAFSGISVGKDCFWSELKITTENKYVPGMKEIIGISSEKRDGLIFREITVEC